MRAETSRLKDIYNSKQNLYIEKETEYKKWLCKKVKVIMVKVNYILRKITMKENMMLYVCLYFQTRCIILKMNEACVNYNKGQI